MLKKLERETGRNYVFEQVQRDKRKNTQSAGTLQTTSNHFGQSSSQGKITQKLMMNQTAMVGS